ncbi:MAG TPA: hypothetical protein VJB66_01655 [Candidatus Nanoarchaeia archaeon]|nr:hypothetical protein [Candidatus Nanoarchaeia archaeon]
MSKKFVLKTENGSFYEVIDESHLFASDIWVIMVNGKRHVILYFGKYRQMMPGPIAAVHGKRGEIKIPVAQKGRGID